MLTVVKAALVAAVAVQALPSNDLRARQNGRIIVEPIPYTGSVPVRQELRKLDATSMNIFLLGLEAMQTMSSSDMKSFYRIAGIHGTNWPYDGIRDGLSRWGFCKHSDPAFPTWHRPYMVLYEKIILDLAKAAVDKWPAGQQKTAHQTALATWRLPYWDWASDPSIPAIMGGTRPSGDNTTIIKLQPNGQVGPVSSLNPLFTYRFPRDNDVSANALAGDGSRTVTDQAVRNGVRATVGGRSVWRTQPDYTNGQMIEAGPNMKTYVFNMFTQERRYDGMSNMRGGRWSLEGVHGTVHITVGGMSTEGEIEGHMTNPAIAGFDPLFFMHHCNVDRLFAIWQKLNPNSYIANNLAGQNLYPFRRTASTFWTSTNSRDTTAFGYTYPELVNADERTLTQTIRTLYGSNSAANLIQDANQRARKMKRGEHIVKRQDTGDNTNLHTPPRTDDLAQNVDKVVNATAPGANAPTTFNEYTANIAAPNNFADGSGKVYIFIGEPESEDWTKDNNFVGSWDVFAPKGMDMTQEVQGAVTLTNAFLNLVNNGRLADLKPNTVRAFLKDHLVWKVSGANKGTDSTKVKINVLTSKVTVPTDERSFPTYGKEFHVYRAH